MSKSIQKPRVLSVWVSPEMADELIDAHGVKPSTSITMQHGTYSIQSYEWDVIANAVKRHINTIVDDQDELARILVLIPTWEGRLSYLNPNDLL